MKELKLVREEKEGEGTITFVHEGRLWEIDAVVTFTKDKEGKCIVANSTGKPSDITDEYFKDSVSFELFRETGNAISP